MADYRVDEAFFVYSRYIHGLRRTGGKYNSPLRDDPVPSFQIFADTGRWWDYGIGAGGDVIDFIKLKHDLSFNKARSEINAMLDGYSNVDLIMHTTTMRKHEQHSKKQFKITNDELMKCSDSLFQNKPTLRMLWNRGLSYDIMQTYKLGLNKYYGKDWLLLPYDFNDGHCWNYKRIRWVDGTKEVRTTGVGKLYPEPMLKQNKLVLCEGELDCLALISNGIFSVSGTCGAGTFKQPWVTEFANKDIIVIYDNDEAGIVGATRAAKMIKSVAKKITIKQWDAFIPNCPGHYDVCQYMEERGDIDELNKFLFG